MGYINNFCDKVYIINLFDKEERWKKVSRQFKKKNIDIQRFVAVDGRCKNQSKEACLSKLKTFEDDPYESRAFLYLDIISWLESNIQNKPIGEIKKNKYSLNIGR